MAKFKIGDNVCILFFENICMKNFRNKPDYIKEIVMEPIYGTIRCVDERSESKGNLYGVEFQGNNKNLALKYLERIMTIERKGADMGLHNCNGLTSYKSGRYMLEDTMEYHYPEKIKPVSITYKMILQTLLKKQDNQEKTTEAI